MTQDVEGQGSSDQPVIGFEPNLGLGLNRHPEVADQIVDLLQGERTRRQAIQSRIEQLLAEAVPGLDFHIPELLQATYKNEEIILLILEARFGSEQSVSGLSREERIRYVKSRIRRAFETAWVSEGQTEPE